MFRQILILFPLCLLSTTVALAEQTPTRPNEPAQAQAQKLSTTPKLFVKGFNFTGNTLLSAEELNAITQKYTGRELAIEQLEEMRQSINNLYLQKGLINSGIIIPDQQVTAGVITLRVIEGKLTSVGVTGLNHFSSSYIKYKLGQSSIDPLNINILQERLQLLQQDPRIKRINSELKPGEILGQADLKVKIEEESPYKITVRFHNDAAPSTGSYKGEASLAHRNVFGYGDTLNIDFGGTRGALDYGGGYTFSILPTDTTIGGYYRKSESTVIEEQFSDLDIKSTSETSGIKIRQPLYHSLSGEFALALVGEHRRSQSTILGRDFSFSLGEQNGAAKVSVVRFGQEYVKRDNSYLLAINSNFNYGLTVLGATENETGPDSRFFSWLGQFMLLGRMGQSQVQGLFKTNAQVAGNGLLPLEKFGLGGMNSVRGYRSNVLLRDTGVNSSLEFRIPVTNGKKAWGTLQIVPFVDGGWGKDAATNSPKEDHIASVGSGIRWSFWEGALLEAYYGYGLNKVTDNKKELADQGIHFQLTLEVL